MLVASSNITTDPTARTYRASVSVRNPTDVAATDITVEIAINDVSGSPMRTETRHIESLASGGTATLELSGEFDPQQVPQNVEVTATASSSSA